MVPNAQALAWQHVPPTAQRCLCCLLLASNGDGDVCIGAIAGPCWRAHVVVSVTMVLAVAMMVVVMLVMAMMVVVAAVTLVLMKVVVAAVAGGDGGGDGGDGGGAGFGAAAAAAPRDHVDIDNACW